MPALTSVSTTPTCHDQHFLRLTAIVVTYNCLCDRISPNDFDLLWRSKMLFGWNCNLFIFTGFFFFFWSVKASLKVTPILLSAAALYYSIQIYKFPCNVQVSLDFFRKDTIHRWTLLSISFKKPAVEWELHVSRFSLKLQNLSQNKEALN